MSDDELNSAGARLDKLLDELAVDDELYTQAVGLVHVPVASPEALVRRLKQSQLDGGEQWAFLTSSTLDPKQQYGLAMPVPESVAGTQMLLFPYVEVHTRAVAWWLTYVWRTNELRAAAVEQYRDKRMIAAAACARSLVETAAQFWVDTRKLAELWAVAKASTPPRAERRELPGCNALVRWLNEVQFGGKFDDRAATSLAVKRASVQTAIDKLAKVTAGDLQTDYQWLCNAVHPSIGNTFVYSAPPLIDEAGTHHLLSFCGRPLVIASAKGMEAETTIEDAISRSVILSLDLLASVLDEALRIIDDIGMTTGAPALSSVPYWRALSEPARNDRCPCRSGKKTKNCAHGWGKPAPGVTKSFI